MNRFSKLSAKPMFPRHFRPTQKNSLESTNGQESGDADKPIGDGFDLESHLEEIRKRYLVRAMQQSNSVKKQASELLGYNSHQVLTNHLVRHGLEARKKKPARRA